MLLRSSTSWGWRSARSSTSWGWRPRPRPRPLHDDAFVVHPCKRCNKTHTSSDRYDTNTMCWERALDSHTYTLPYKNMNCRQFPRNMGCWAAPQENTGSSPGTPACGAVPHELRAVPQAVPQGQQAVPPEHGVWGRFPRKMLGVPQELLWCGAVPQENAGSSPGTPMVWGSSPGQCWQFSRNPYGVGKFPRKTQAVP